MNLIQKKYSPATHDILFIQIIRLFFWGDVVAGSIVPSHQHMHEQIVIVREGQFELTVNGETKMMDKNMTAVIPGNTTHSGIAITDCKLLDIFYPIREDYK